MDFNKMKKMEQAVRIGGKGSVRRKHKRLPSAAATERRVQAELAMLPLNELHDIHEVAIEFTDSSEVVFTMPKVRGSNQNSFFVVSGDIVRKSSTAGASKVAKAPKPANPPKPESEESIKVVAKKPKKPRNRVRPRNKKVQMMLFKNDEEVAMAGGDSEPKLSNGKSILISSEDASDPDNDNVPSDESDVDQTIVCDKDSLESGDDSSEDGGDPDNDNVPSDESDVDKTIVCDKDSLESGDDSDGKEDDDSKE
ncbi:nascent polypeptide-associated complex subunit beta-like [Drosophila simulans]|uniref:Transcription factor BTF3 n=1 Tax=Drosophila simulans TaxID=7240 RepID=B4R4U1_DROSI|nr:nascent polypeptide-associated complex subunit beta-like [Drosophila simulans]EDX17898.1 GD17170 [Drosophila simulans]